MIQWSDVWKIIVTLVTSIGGAGVLITVFISFVSSVLSKRIEQKYQSKLDVEFEKYEKFLEKQNYILQVRFDTEFEAIKKIHQAMFYVNTSMRAYTVILCKSIIDNNPQQYIKYYSIGNLEAVKHLADLQSAVSVNVAFVNARLGKEYIEVLDMLAKQFEEFDDIFELLRNGKDIRSIEAEIKRINEREDKINVKIDDIVENVRDYYDSVTII